MALFYGNIGVESETCEEYTFICDKCKKTITQKFSNQYPEWLGAKYKGIHWECTEKIVMEDKINSTSSLNKLEN